MRVHKLIKLRYKVGNGDGCELRAASAARICRIITGRELCDSFAGAGAGAGGVATLPGGAKLLL